jgi:hypothetical protein
MAEERGARWAPPEGPDAGGLQAVAPPGPALPSAHGFRICPRHQSAARGRGR